MSARAPEVEDILGAHAADRDHRDLHGAGDKSDELDTRGSAAEVTWSLEDRPGHAPRRACCLGLHCFLDAVNARADGNAVAHRERVSYRQGMRGELSAARAHRDCDIDPVVDDEPAARLFLDCREFLGELEEPTARCFRRSQVQRPARPKRAHDGRGAGEKPGLQQNR